MITDASTHAQKPTAKTEFWIQEASKYVNTSESPFRKFKPKAILSLPYMGETK